MSGGLSARPGLACAAPRRGRGEGPLQEDAGRQTHAGGTGPGLGVSPASSEPPWLTEQPVRWLVWPWIPGAGETEGGRAFVDESAANTLAP